MTYPRAAGSADGSPRSEREPLSLTRVLHAALAIVDAGGTDALSMRRLAQSLDCEPMSLYRYAANKAALLDGVVELVLTELTVNPQADCWRAELRRVSVDFRAVALRHPQVVPLLVTRPRATPLGLRPLGTLRPLENILELLTRAGFAVTAALRAYRLLFSYLHGHILDELQEFMVQPEETDALLRLGLQRLPPEQFPHLRAMPEILASYDGTTQLHKAIDLILQGIANDCR